jgi:release factor glutamine methyltransferase
MNTTGSVAAALDWGAARLQAAGIASARLDARLLLAHALSRSPDMLVVALSETVPTASFAALIERRAAREPVALILGRREFWSLDFAVSAATLVPRPDSETVVAAALERERGAPPVRRVLDLGTGTGCLLLAVLSEAAEASGVGVDRSPEAATLAARNARALGLDRRAAFVAGNWADSLIGRFDRILSNPPYIPTATLATLMPEVARFEPASALDGGADGLDAYRAIIPALLRLLAPGGRAVLEVGEGQAESVAALGVAAGFRAETRADLAGIARAVMLRAA